jgi:bacterioferritin-associated ferredoxin
LTEEEAGRIIILIDNSYHNRCLRTRTLLDEKGVQPMYLCLCKGITDSDIREAGQAGIVMPCQLKAKFGLKDPGCCGRCSKNIHEFAEIAMSAQQASSLNSLRR